MPKRIVIAGLAVLVAGAVLAETVVELTDPEGDDHGDGITDFGDTHCSAVPQPHLALRGAGEDAAGR